jgi:hypothetical protein
LREMKLYYYETGNGVELFCKMNFKDAADRSLSFARLFEQIAPYCRKLRS